MRTLKKLTITLALLIMAVSGAWADETPLLTIESKDYTSFTSGSKTFDDKVTVTFSNPVYYDGEEGWWYAGGDPSLLTVAGINGYTITSCKFYTGYGYADTGYPVEGESPSVYLYGGFVFNDASQSVTLGYEGVTKIEVYGTAPATEWSLTPDETGKNWTLASMPASNIELQVEYFAESNLFLSKNALADKTNIAVTAGDLGVQFGNDGKSANTITEGTPMTVKYNGTKKVIGFKVEKKAAPATLIANPVVGQVIGSDGKNYDANATLPDGVTAVAMIAYVSGSNGLALALTDEEGIYTWDNTGSFNEHKTAPEIISAWNTSKAVTGGTWKLPSQDEWKQMFSANGGNEGSYTGLNTAIDNAGGTALKEFGEYWSSSEVDEGYAWLVSLAEGNASWLDEGKHYARMVRACLAF